MTEMPAHLGETAIKKRACVRAFTLAEVMMAAFVLALGLVGMIQVITSGSEMLDTSRKQAIAIRIIQSQIDQYRGSIPADWSQVTNATTSINLSSTPFAGVTTGFTCSRTISNANGDGTLRKITYTVTWTGNTGRSHTRTGSTYIGKHGLHVSYQRN